MTRILAAAAALTVTVVACTHAGSATTSDAAPSQPPATVRPAPSGSDAQTVAEFRKRLDAYTALHNKIEKTLPPVPKETTSAIIDTHQRALEALLKEHRKTARRGDLFTPDVERLIRRLLAQLFAGPDGATLKATIMDENPMGIKLAVNSRYPDDVPHSTMPPQVLALLPKLTEDLEYRFIGDRLILLDIHAHTVADFIEKALP